MLARIPTGAPSPIIEVLAQPISAPLICSARDTGERFGSWSLFHLVRYNLPGSLSKTGITVAVLPEASVEGFSPALPSDTCGMLDKPHRALLEVYYGGYFYCSNRECDGNIFRRASAYWGQSDNTYDMALGVSSPIGRVDLFWASTCAPFLVEQNTSADFPLEYCIRRSAFRFLEVKEMY
ncbi:hypothetical protein Tco_1251399 [Tanacetum coccineum]